jgi:hypothetical protein
LLTRFGKDGQHELVVPRSVRKPSPK